MRFYRFVVLEVDSAASLLAEERVAIKRGVAN